MTIKFYNNNDSFGNEGPFEAEKKEDVVSEFDELLDTWTAEYGDEHNLDAEDRAEYRDNLVKDLLASLGAQYHGEARIIFDNGGGITLQLPGFAHYYTDAEQCAQDICNWEDDRDTTGWEGNEEESVFEPTHDQINNGGYRVWTLADFNNRSNWDELKNSSWANIAALFERLQ